VDLLKVLAWTDVIVKFARTVINNVESARIFEDFMGSI